MKLSYTETHLKLTFGKEKTLKIASRSMKKGKQNHRFYKLRINTTEKVI